MILGQPWYTRISELEQIDHLEVYGWLIDVFYANIDFLSKKNMFLFMKLINGLCKNVECNFLILINKEKTGLDTNLAFWDNY